MDGTRIFAPFVLVGAMLWTGNGCATSSLESLFRRDVSEDDGGNFATRERGSESLVSSAGRVDWHESWETAVSESRSTGRPILADFTGSDWCHWCTKLKQDVFESPSFREWSKENVVLLEIDFPKRRNQAADIKQQNEQLAARYRISSYPTVLMLAPDGQVIGQVKYQQGMSATSWVQAANALLSH